MNGTICKITFSTINLKLVFFLFYVSAKCSNPDSRQTIEQFTKFQKVSFKLIVLILQLYQLRVH